MEKKCGWKISTVIMLLLAVILALSACGGNGETPNGETKEPQTEDPAHDHTYSTDYHMNATHHYYECACGEKKAEAAHISSGPATASVAEVCTECGYVITPATGILFKTLTVNGTTVTGTVPNQTTVFSFPNEVQVNGNAKYVVSMDIAGNSVVTTKSVSLSPGDNTVYITEFIDDDPTVTYTVTIRRKPIYTVTFDTNGAAPIEAKNVEEGEKLTAPEIARTGYTFTGWDYDFTAPITANTVITAGWSIIAYNITYVLNGGENASTTPTTYTVENVITLAKPTRVGYIFKGWFSDEALTQKVTRIEKGSTGSKTVYAKWEYGTEGLQYSLSYDTYTVTAYTGTATNVVIPPTYLGKAVTSIGSSAFNGCTSFTSITIPSSVQNIGNEAFRDCSNLATVTFAENSQCSGIGDSALKGCSSLTSIVIPDSVTNIGSSAFNGCTSLTSITIPSSVQNIGTYAFRNCSKLTAVTFAENSQCSGIGEEAFSGCSSLTSITIPNSVTSIGNAAFNGCTSLTSIVIPDSVTGIGDSAFKGCSSLTSIVIPDSVTSIGTSAFNGCTSLSNITIPAGVTSIGSSAFSGCSSLTSITIPSSVTSIGSGAFSGCSSLVEMTIPFVGAKADVTSSDTYRYPFGYIFGGYSYTGGVATRQCFNGSTASSTYYIPSSLKKVTVTGGSILYGAFYNCSNLTSITIPDSVTSIGSCAFYKCSNLTSITIPASVTSIGSSAFSGCSNLTSITIPDSVTSIGSSAFSGCSSLTSITIPSSVTSIGSGAFSGCSSLVEMMIPFVGAKADVTSSDTDQYPFGYIFGTTSDTGGVKTTQYYYGSSTSSTTSSTYYIPASLKKVMVTGGNILYGAFYNCSNLTSIVIPDSVTGIGDSAFKGCSSLTSIVIPDSVTSIGGYAFRGCTSLTSLVVAEGNTKYHSSGNCIIETATKTLIAGCKMSVIPNDGSVTSIGSYAFENCSNLTSITIPSSVQNIGDYAFYYCSNLTAVTFAENSQCSGIGTSAFYYCSNLTSITIPAGVTSIGSSAFSGCSNLTSITIPAGVTSIGSSAFSGCSNLTSITIPDSVTSIGSSAFKGCSSLTSITIPSSVTSIGSGAFSGCSSLVEMTIPFVGAKADVTSSDTYRYPFGYIFGGYSYTGGVKTEQCYYGSNTSSIITHDYYYIPSSLKKVTVTGGSILFGAFCNCSNLTSITIPASVTSIGSSAFSGCSSLTSITFTGTKAQWKSISKGSSWKFDVPFTCKVHCTDGDLSI